VSRSATIVLSYLMKFQKMSLKDSFEFVRIFLINCKGE
jgi:protein-tyrosine phosphatase